ncbi:uncharacterized protein LOC103839723 isoform X1 [Brassica rapa]|uniref:uncharacterized protein LOC103839723 isoform X1 n=1 Tax=Brassica campestris TaxID=3711 RepID=UPI0004F17FBA|nr:uncharacterized protein LOC103839723 isoform X1 [Brassica rapa]
MAAKEEDGNVNADGNLAEAGEMDELLQEISDVLRSQVDIASLPPVHEDESNLGEKKETTDTSASCSQGVDRSIHNISSDQETSNEQGTSTNQLFAVSSTTSNVPVNSVEATFQPSSSDITNVETKSVPVNSGEYEMFCRFGAPTMDDALKMRYNLVINESVTKAPVENDRPLPDDEDVTNSIDYTSSEYDETRDRLKMPFSLLPIENVDDSKELSKIDPSSSDHLEAEHVQSGTHEPVNQPMPTRQTITTTASSPGGRSLSVPMTKALITSTDFVPKRNQQAMNLPQTQRNLPQTQRNQQAMNLPQTQRPPSGQYGNITRPPYLPPSAVLPLQQHGGSTTSNMAHYVTMVTSPYWRPEQNAIYNMPPQSAAAFQQHGRSNMMTFPYWRPEQHGSYNMPQYSAASMVPSAYGSANTFGTWSDNNPANSRFGYEGGVSSNYLPSIQPHQSGDFNAWRPSSSHSPQEQQIWNDVYASMDQQNDGSDPSDETQPTKR